MSSHPPRTLIIAAAWTGIVLAGAAAGAWAWRAREEDMLEQLSRDAARATVAFGAGELQQLAGAEADRGSPTYTALKRRLQKLQAADPDLRLAALLRYGRNAGSSASAGAVPPTLIYLVESRPLGGGDDAAPGSEYPPSRGWTVLRAALEAGEPAVERPFSDESGTWVRVASWVDSQAAHVSGAAGRDILLLEVQVKHWLRQLAQAGFQGAFFVWIFLGVPFGAWLAMRRQIEQREVIRNLSEAMEQSHSAIMIVDLGGRIEYANRGLCQQIGYSRYELIARTWQEFRAETSADVFSDLMTTVRAGRSWEGEWFNQRKDGEVYPVRGVVTPVKQRDGTLSCFVAVFDDVTETKRREEELREARDLAEAGDRAKGHFLATMSHEVRTPLNGIAGFTSLLLETPLSSEQREYVQTIRMSAEALIQLTGDILDFARIESGKLKLDPIACDPRECVEDALDLLAAKAAEKKIELLHRVGEDVPAAVVIDGGRLRQVLVNLVGNAVKFTERGEVEVSLAVERGTAPDARENAGEETCTLKFAVRDTGIGIAAEHQAKLFHPFTQVDESTTRRYGGTGLGLAICRNLVELMGGRIRAVSAPARGSTFEFTVRAPVTAAEAPQRKLSGLRLGLAVRPGTLRRQLAQLLRSWEVTVNEASTPEELVGPEWDLALVEVCEDIARELAENEPLAGLPPEKTLGLVPVSLSNELRTALRAHFRLLVNRPVRHEALFSVLSGAQPQVTATTAPTQFGFRVLVVEDNPVNRRLVQRVLENLGCRPTLVEDGRKALVELQANAENYDLMLLDLHMPEMDGLAVLREIRSGNAGPRAQTMWIIALTADAREPQRARGMAEGLNEYLTKPLKLPELEAAFRRFRQEWMERKR